MSDAPTAIERPAFGPQGEPCANCGALLARDQRYCLECGTRRAGMDAMLSAPSAVREVTTERIGEPGISESAWKLDAGLLAGVGCLLLALLVGVLIGRSGGGDAGQGARAASPQVITVPGAGAATGVAATAAFKSDWPAGKRGFTVLLQTLPKASSDAAKVAVAKQAAAAKGAADVGALDSDAYGTLGPGNYVIYSGLFADRKAASAALAKLKASFPGATVVEVAEKTTTAAKGAKKASAKQQSAATGKSKKPSAAEQAAGAQAIQDVQNATGKDYSKKSAKLPDKLATPGQPPPKDLSKPAGGGSDTQTFK
jgi:hypothetical protein